MRHFLVNSLYKRGLVVPCQPRASFSVFAGTSRMHGGLGVLPPRLRRPTTKTLTRSMSGHRFRDDRGDDHDGGSSNWRSYFTVFVVSLPGGVLLALWQLGYLKHPALEARLRRWRTAVLGPPATTPGVVRDHGPSPSPSFQWTNGVQTVTRLDDLDAAVAGRSAYLLLIGAPWCSYCVQFYPYFDQISGHLAGDTRFAFVHYNELGARASQSTALARYGARTLPTLVIGNSVTGQWRTIPRGNWSPEQTALLMEKASDGSLFI